MSDAPEPRVFLDGYLDVPADRLENVRKALPEHIALTQAEPGCLSFCVEEDKNRPGRFKVTEVFENQRAFDTHQARTRASEWFKITERIPRHYTVRTEGAAQD